MILKSITTLLALTLIAFRPTIAQPNLDQFFQGLITKHEIPAISVTIIEKGEVSYSEAHGVQANDTQTPVNKQTTFSAASLSKQIFAYTVMKLVESKEIDLDKPLYQYLEYKDLQHDDRYKKITARMVLSHSSGLPNWRRGKLEILFEPGKKFQYSGEGFVYLMKVVEGIKGKEINAVVDELVFKPLEMKNSSLKWEDRFESNYASPHDFTGFTIPKRKRKKSNVAYSLQTTSEDYAKFILAVLNEKGLKKSTIKEITAEQISVDGQDNLHWGLGWGIQKTKKGKAIWQWGDNGTYKAFTINYLKEKKGIVFLTNSENGMRIVPEVIERIFNDEYPAFEWADYRLEDAPYQKVLKRALTDGFDAAIKSFWDQNKEHHDTTQISENRMKRVGFRLLRESRFDDAKKAYLSNVKAYNSFDSYLQYANCCLKSGDFKEAKAYYLKAQSLKPKDEFINTILTQLEPNSIKANVTFRLRQTNYMYSNLITIAGDFNNWNSMSHPFIKQNGEWICKLKLEPGTYHYKLIIDGIWTLDPENVKTELDDGDNVNSVLVVE